MIKSLNAHYRAKIHTHTKLLYNTSTIYIQAEKACSLLLDSPFVKVCIKST